VVDELVPNQISSTRVR